MKKLIILFALLLALPCYGQQGWVVDNFGNHTPLNLARMNVGIVGASATAGCTPSTGACTNATTGECGTTYLACEDFEGSAYCLGESGANNCRVTWSTYDTIPLWTGTGIEGTYAAQLAIDATRSFFKLWTDADALYMFYRLKLGTLTHDTDTPVSRILDQAYMVLVSTLNVEVDATHTAQDWKLVCNGGTPAYNVAPAPADDATYYVWHEVVKGANNTCRVYISTTASKPGSPTIEVTDGTADQVGIAEFRAGITGGQPFTVDHIRVSATAMTGVPD